MTALAVDQRLTDSKMSRERVRRLLCTTEQKLRQWDSICFGEAHETYTLGEFARLKVVAKLLSGVSAPRFRKQIDALAKRENVSDPLSEFRLYTDHQKLLIDLPGQAVDAVSGQLLLDLENRFRPAVTSTAVSFPATNASATARKEDSRKREEAEEWFERALEMEQTGAPAEQIREAYERAIELDPKSTGALVNLGTICFGMRALSKAEKLYLRAVEVDPQYSLAHFNLGNLYDERGNIEKALHHYGEALKINPRYPDAHYNLALLFQNQGQSMRAVQHWQAYLKLDNGSNWAGIARRELDKLKDAAIVK